MNKGQIFEIFYDKDNAENYAKFKKIESSIEKSNELYTYFDEIKMMLIDKKTSVRVRGFRIICKLAKWDNENKIDEIIKTLLTELDDEKPTAVRQCLTSLNDLIRYKPELGKKIKTKLNKFDYSKFNDSMTPLIKKDMEVVLRNI